MLLLLFRPYGVSAPVVVVDTHDTFKEDEAYRKRRARLRETLEMAFNSQFGIEVEAELTEFIAPQLTDSVTRPAMERLDFELAWSRYEEIMERIERVRMLEEDEEDSILLLS